MPLMNGLSAAPWVKATTTWPLPLTVTVNCRTSARSRLFGKPRRQPVRRHGSSEHEYLSFQPRQIDPANNLALENQEHDNRRNTGQGQRGDQVIKRQIRIQTRQVVEPDRERLEVAISKHQQGPEKILP